MKVNLTGVKKIIKISLLSFGFLSLTNFTHAESLALSFPDVVKDAKEIFTGKLKLDIVTGNSTTTEEIVEKVPREKCEIYDDAVLNIVSLDTASAEAKQKIDKIEEKLDEESLLRESVFENVKGLLGLQKKDKVIFREMRKELKDARNYYQDLDEKIEDLGNTLFGTTCEEQDEDKLKDVGESLSDMSSDEVTFKKQFVGSLKDKMQILQAEVKNAKKN